MTPPTWRSLVADAVTRLAAAPAELHLGPPAQEARWMAEEASGHEGAEYLEVLDRPAPDRPRLHFERMLERRLVGEPIQYVLGRWSFRSLDLFVDRRVLIPRPETEVLVDHALAELDRCRHDRGDGPSVAVDLGTGSGAIALSLAAERERVEVWAVERSPTALAVARANLAGVGRAGARVRLVEGSWFDPLPAELRGRVDVVVANPPYVTDDEPLPDAVASWEPVEALRAGPAGLDDLAAIVAGAPSWLAEHGALVLELAPGQVAAVTELAEINGLGAVAVERDLAGHDRVLVARRLSR